MKNISIEMFATNMCEAVQGQLGEGFRVEWQEMVKNNNVALIGLVIINGECNISPTIYLEQFYQLYLDGRELSELAERVVEIYKRDVVKESVSLSFFQDFECVKSRICFKLINKQFNEELLQDIPYVDFLNLAACFFYAYEGELLGEGTILIHNSHMKMWKTDVETLMECAKENTPKLFPWELTSMETIIRQIMTQNAFDNSTDSCEIAGEYPMQILSNSKKIFGASCLLYPHIMKKIGQGIGRNFYILPSSIHELILLPDNYSGSHKELRDMVYEVNHTQLEPQDILADSLYYFDISKQSFSIL